MITKKNLLNLLKGHLNRLDSAHDSNDERFYFEVLYDCFEVLNQLQLVEDSDYKRLERLSHQSYSFPNHNLLNKNKSLKEIFKKTVLEDFRKSPHNPLKKLKEFNPIINNENGKEFKIENEEDFKTIQISLRYIRNNLRHGMKEYSQRSKDMISTANNILYKIIANSRTHYFNSDKSLNNVKPINIVPLLLTILFFAFIFWFFLGPLFVGFDETEKCSSYYVPNSPPCEP